MLQNRSTLSYVVLGLFLLPFCGIGLAVLVEAVGVIIDGDWEQGGLLLLFGLAFGGAGFGVLTALVVGRRKAKEGETLRTQSPGEPWRWRREWAEGRVESSAKPALWMFWIFAFLWNVVSTPLLFFLPEEILEKDNTPALLGLLFPLVGIGLLAYALRLTIAWKKFGRSVFAMHSWPAPVGGELAGNVLLETNVNPPNGFDLKLSCVRRTTTGTGKNRSTHETILWQESSDDVPGVVRGDAPGVAIPVRFRIPRDAEPSSPERGDGIIWRLQVDGEVPGVDYGAQFDVPVFDTGQPLPPLPEEPAAVPAPVSEVMFEAAGVQREITPDGGEGYHLLPARNPGTAVAMTFFTLLWSGIVAVMFVAGAPLLFPVVFGAVDLLLLYATLLLWGGSSRISVGQETLVLTNALFGLAVVRRIPAGEITRITTAITMQSGTTPYYSISIERRGARPARTLVSVRNKRVAERIAADLAKRLGHSMQEVP